MLKFLIQTEGEEAIESLIVPDSIQKARFVEVVKNLADLDVQSIVHEIVSWMIWTGIKICIALAIYYLGRWLLHRLIRMVERIMERRGTEITLHTFLLTLIRTCGYIVLVVVIVTVLGVDSTSFVAILASMGLAIGMALSGTLQNFAGGIMVMFMHPYRIGDYIEAQGQAGTVKEIKLFSTVITTTDNKRIYIPNSSISNAIVNNYSAETMRRVEWKISLAYGDDVDVAKQTMSAMIEADPRVLHAPEAPANPFVALSELADSSIVMLARVWVRTADYWDLYFDMNERFYRELPEKGLHFPFPQLDVHLDKQ